MKIIDKAKAKIAKWLDEHPKAKPYHEYGTVENRKERIYTISPAHERRGACKAPGSWKEAR